MDDKVENNEALIKKLSDIGRLSYLKSTKNDDGESVLLGDIIRFVKGKTPSENGTTRLPYINMDGVKSGKYELVFSDEMVLCDKDDILMVMDGASSGAIFIGQAGIVASTFSKLEVSQKYLEFVYWFLYGEQSVIGQQNTGSAIPHANKDFVNSLLLLLPKIDKTQDSLHTIRETILALKTETAKLTELKEQYLKKFFN